MKASSASQRLLPPPAITSEAIATETSWLSLKRIKYTTQSGSERTWEACERTTRRKNASADGVMVIAKVRRKGRVFVPLVCQFRPPTQRLTLEFPAGLLDEGETPESTAIRELYEETGLSGGKVVGEPSPPLALDPGMSNSCIIVVTLDVDGDSPANINAQPHPVVNEGEEIQVFYLEDFSRKGVSALASKHNLLIDANLWMAMSHDLHL